MATQQAALKFRDENSTVYGNLWILLIPYLSFILTGATKCFSPKGRAEEMKASSHFRFCLGKCAAEFEFMGQEFPDVFLGLQKFAKYYIYVFSVYSIS